MSARSALRQGWQVLESSPYRHLVHYIDDEVGRVDGPAVIYLPTVGVASPARQDYYLGYNFIIATDDARWLALSGDYPA